MELLEPRQLLSANSLADQALIFDPGMSASVGVLSATQSNSGSPPAGTFELCPAIPPTQGLGGSLASGALLEVFPFALEDTFFLHSLPGATAVIYLDFDGFITRDTPWNTDFNLPNIVTPAYDFDGDILSFSDDELAVIQLVWERVAEDFRPFNIDVTTEDPGIEALRRTGAADLEYGQRVAIGGTNNDWFKPIDGFNAGGVAHGSFTASIDDPCFVFYGGNPDFAALADTVSHEVGHTLGLAHDGQTRFYNDISTTPPTARQQHFDYYGGHPDTPTGAPTDWAAIMGAGFGKDLSQWSQGEYPNADNAQDDLMIISSNNGPGVSYRADDHGDTIATAVALQLDPATIDADENMFADEGIIERNTDIDFFSFTVELLGELISLDVTPFHNGPNLDILAKLYDSTGTIIATSNPLDDLLAGSQSFGTYSDGGWFVIETQEYVSEFFFLPGTYYISIEGTGRPITFIDPVGHPDLYEVDGTIAAPDSVPDESDWGYTNYGSLGYYSITGARKRNLVVGVDFDVAGGTSPVNWNLYSGGSSPTVLTNLTSEIGELVPYNLSISSSGPTINTVASANPINTAELPNHGIALDEVAGYISTDDATWTFTWSNLEPSAVYQVYVFGHADAAIRNSISVVGGPWNGVQQTFNFPQMVAADGLVVGNNVPGNNELSSYALLVISNAAGEITITATNEAGFEGALAGLAIAPTKLGSINGQKWNDGGVGPNNVGAGNGVLDDGEVGLPGWIIYLDVNNNGQLDQLIIPDETTTQASDDVPQVLVDGTTVKSSLVFQPAGNILDVDVGLDITHSYDADLEVYLISPLGTRVKLFADVGSFGDNFTSTVFDDSALTPITSGTAPFTGHFRPQEPLSALNGENAQGEWRLELTDDASNDNGVLNSWYITVKYNPTPDVVATVSSTDVPVPILDLQTVTSQLTVQHSGVISDVNVKLDITHTWDADLNVFLISPTGTRVKLFAGVGQGNDNFQNTVLDDEALASITTGVAPFTGDFRPQEPLSRFDGELSQGVWKLEITDTFGADQGTLNSWSITVRTKGVITYLEPYTTTDANGNYAFTDLPPGVYYVREHFQTEQLQAGWRQVWQPPVPITVKSGSNVLNIDFGNWIPLNQRGSIQGQKFNDLDGNGVKNGAETGLAGWVIYVDSNDNGVRDVPTTPTMLFSADVPKPINDLSTISSQINFPGIGTVFNVTVTLDITHSFMGDLEAYLVSPTGTQIELFTEVGGQFNDFHNLTLDDGAARSIATLGAADLPYTGTWRPEGLLSDLIGEDSNGLWTLVIRDIDAADEGTLNSWSLNIKSGDIFTTTDVDGNYVFDNLPGGQYIIREEPQPGWVPIPPQTVDIPGAKWTNSRWEVVVDPNGPDPLRNVKNVNFGNREQPQLLPGDYNLDGHVDSGDYALWRRTLGTPVPNFSGADGDGDGIIGNGDYGVWRAHFGQSSGPGAGSSLPASGDGGSGAGSTAALTGGGGAALAPSGSATAAPATTASSGKTKSFGAAPAAAAAASAPEAASGATKSASGSAASAKVASSSEPASSIGGTSTFYAVTGGSLGRSHDRPFERASVATRSRIDSALLSWLSESSQSHQSDSDGEYGVGDGSPPSDDVESVDAAFASLEELLLTGIAV